MLNMMTNSTDLFTEEYTSDLFEIEIQDNLLFRIKMRTQKLLSVFHTGC